jgi:hypothetical protein
MHGLRCSKLMRPKPPPVYMKDNINNYFGSAPDAGVLAGPVLTPLNNSMLSEIHIVSNSSAPSSTTGETTKEKRAGDGYWLSTAGTAGKVHDEFASSKCALLTL